MPSQCSFCNRKVGQGSHDRIVKFLESADSKMLRGREIDFKAAADRLRKSPSREVKLILPGPGDIYICDICIDLYADTVRRELAARE